MLVLSRKAGEEIVLPNRGVTIGVVAVCCGLGVDGNVGP
jgi:sRNA-binding carbon storage regulator CsrA